MSAEETARARAGEQDVNNANQARNDAQQGRNDAEMESSNKEQSQTNKDQAKTNLEQTKTNLGQTTTNAAQGVTNSDQSDTNTTQEYTNTAQGVTNTAQGVTNTAQGVTNSAQGVTNSEQCDINTEVQDSIAEMKQGASETLSNNVIILKTVRTLAASLDANTLSLQAVSDALDENQKYTESIEKKSNSRANTFKRMWVLVVAIVLLIGIGGFGLNSYRTSQLCMQRNEISAVNAALIQDNVDDLLANDPQSPRLPALQDFLNASTPLDCNGFL